MVILLCGIENATILYDILNIDQSNQILTTDQDPEEYLEVILGIIQQGNSFLFFSHSFFKKKVLNVLSHFFKKRLRKPLAEMISSVLIKI